MRRNGFTLIEMSIVLLIIGLIAAAVLAGQSFIRQSQINSAMTDVQRYISATKNFQQKYGALPGDMSNATSYWGAQSSPGTCPPTAGGSSVGGTATCNGNGSGQIDYAIESLLYWQHLANAQLISGSFSGIPGSAGTQDNVIDSNCPSTRIKGAGLSTYYAGSTHSTTNWYNGSWGHVFVLGSYASNQATVGASLTSNEAYVFDKKYDDGLPATGTIATFNTTLLPNCSVAASGSTPAQYSTVANGAACSIIIVTGY